MLKKQKHRANNEVQKKLKCVINHYQNCFFFLFNSILTLLIQSSLKQQSVQRHLCTFPFFHQRNNILKTNIDSGIWKLKCLLQACVFVLYVFMEREVLLLVRNRRYFQLLNINKSMSYLHKSMKNTEMLGCIRKEVSIKNSCRNTKR